MPTQRLHWWQLKLSWLNQPYLGVGVLSVLPNANYVSIGVGLSSYRGKELKRQVMHCSIQCKYQTLLMYFVFCLINLLNWSLDNAAYSTMHILHFTFILSLILFTPSPKLNAYSRLSAITLDVQYNSCKKNSCKKKKMIMGARWTAKL